MSYVGPNPSQRAIFFLKRFEDGSSCISEGQGLGHLSP
jgi:hypothetical protein